MQTTSALWKSLWASGDARLEAKAIIAGVEYTDITAPVINRALMQNGLSVGNAVACTCSFTVRGAGTIPRSAEVIIKARLTDGTQTSEWLPCGTFYVSRRRRDAVTGQVELECYDAMLKANATYEATGAWPRAMADVVTEIAALLGVAIDPRTQINTGSAYMVSLPEAWATINNILADIATAHGGNWIITPAGMLRLVPMISASGAASAAEAVEVEGVIGSLTVGATQEVTGIRVAGDDGDTMIGDESGLVVSIDSPYVNETSAAVLGVMLIGQTYQSYTMTQAVYDPAAELGDYLRGGAGGEVNSVLYGEVATLGAAYRANVTALEVAEIADEYPYIGGNEAMAEQVRRLSSVVADKASVEDLEAVDARLDNLSASDIKAGIIHSADYETVDIPLIYPAAALYPATDLFPNYGERVIKGFAVDFATGQIYGAFYSTQIEKLQEAVEALQNSLVYPKAETAPLLRMELYPYNLTSVKTAMEQKEDEE
jgi:hypothetical protein